MNGFGNSIKRGSLFSVEESAAKKQRVGGNHAAPAHANGVALVALLSQLEKGTLRLEDILANEGQLMDLLNALQSQESPDIHTKALLLFRRLACTPIGAQALVSSGCLGYAVAVLQ